MPWAVLLLLLALGVTCYQHESEVIWATPTLTHTQTHNIPTDSTAVGRMLRFITMLFYDWSFVQESECWNVCMNIIRINNLSFSQLSQEEHTKMSERREKKSIFLSSLLVSFPLLPHIRLFYLIFDKIFSLAYLHTSLTPPLHPLSLAVCIPLLFSLLFSSFLLKS